MGAAASDPCGVLDLEGAVGAGKAVAVPASSGSGEGDGHDATHRLKQAAVLGDAALARRLLAAGAAVNAAGEAGLTPLHLAAKHGRAEVARALLGAGADPHARARPPSCQAPLALAACAGHAAVYELLWRAERLEAAGSASEASEGGASEGGASSGGSASGSSASGSASEAESDGSLERFTLEGALERERGLWGLAERRVAYRLRRGDGPPRHLHAPAAFRVRGAPECGLAYVEVPGLLSPAEVAEVHAAGRQPSARRCADRSEELVYDHVAYRCEGELRARARRLYRRLLGVMVWADQVLWGSLGCTAKVFPEVEYIRYDGRPSDAEYAIHPHVDNRSLVTLVCMLSRPGDFAGGVLGFQPPSDEDDGGEDRLEEPGLGTAVVFRGELLQHWVTPVTAGTRYVLQIELSSV